MTHYVGQLANTRPLEGEINAAGEPWSIYGWLVEPDEFDEAGLVQWAGMDYVQTPVASTEDMNEANAHALNDALDSESLPVVVHCDSANRVGALIAYRPRYLQNKNADEVSEFGLATGLNRTSSLADARRQKLD